jgi:hypothetical protein
MVKMQKKMYQSFFNKSTAENGQQSLTYKSCNTLCCTNIMVYFRHFRAIIARRSNMADQSNSSNSLGSSGFSIEQLVNGVLLHPQFRHVVSNMTSSQNSTSSVTSTTTNTSAGPSTPPAGPSTPPVLTHSSATTSHVGNQNQSPAEELRAIFRRGTSSQQQQNINATIPRFNSRFSYQPRGRRNTTRRLNSNEGKQKTTGKRCGQTPAKQSFCREVVLLRSPDDTKVVRGHSKAALHRAGNVISAFKFEKSWCFSTVCEELNKAFPQLGRINTMPK